MIKRSTQGFTIVELLIVLAIIGLISTLAVVALGSARADARDTQRLADMQGLQFGLEQYFNVNNAYPETEIEVLLGQQDTSCLGAEGFSAVPCNNAFMQVPMDPGKGQYLYRSDGNDYQISATLEGEVRGLQGRIQVSKNQIIQLGP